jgi:hypothetical protein
MALTIELRPEKEDVLRDVAARRGLPPEEYARELLERSLPRTAARAPEERARAFQEWADSHGDVTAVVMDDSRQGIYADGEDRG